MKVDQIKSFKNITLPLRSLNDALDALLTRRSVWETTQRVVEVIPSRSFGRPPPLVLSQALKPSFRETRSSGLCSHSRSSSARQSSQVARSRWASEKEVEIRKFQVARRSAPALLSFENKRESSAVPLPSAPNSNSWSNIISKIYCGIQDAVRMCGNGQLTVNFGVERLGYEKQRSVALSQASISAFQHMFPDLLRVSTRRPMFFMRDIHAAYGISTCLSVSRITLGQSNACLWWNSEKCLRESTCSAFPY